MFQNNFNSMEKLGNKISLPLDLQQEETEGNFPGC